MKSLNQIIEHTCKIGQGADCCKYLVIGGDGWECCKVTPENKALIDRNWETTEHVAQGDNCEGHTMTELNA